MLLDTNTYESRLVFKGDLWLILWLPLLLSGFLFPLHGSAQESERPRPAVPLDPIEGVVDAFRTHNLIAISKGASHGDEQAHAFLRSLISDPRFTSTVNDIVVEFGSALYQDVMDRFVSGEKVPEAELQKAWQNTVSPSTNWDIPVFEEFFRAVRKTNASLPKEQRLRVLLGEPPINWETIRTQEDYNEQLYRLGNRDGHAADLIRREVLQKHRRALIIYGGLHFQRKNLFANYSADWPEADTLVMQLTSTVPTKIFTIWWAADLEELQENTASWPVPSMAIVAGTVLGVADFSFYARYEGERRIVRDGKPYVVPRKQWQTLPMEEQFDAVMYAGPSSLIAVSKLSQVKCSDAAYMEMRLQRMALFDWAKSAADELKQYCKDQEMDTKR